MLGRGLLLGGYPTPIAFRSGATTNNDTAAAKPAGVAVGDLVVVVGSDSTQTLTTVTGSAWSRTQVGSVGFYLKILNATDVAQPWSWGGAGIYSTAAAYSANGIAIVSATVKSTGSTASGGATTLTLAGFAQSAAGKPRGVVSLIEEDTGGGTTPATPAGFTSRQTNVGGFGSRIADMLVGYSGQSVVWTGVDAGAGDAHAVLIEVL